MQNTQHSLFDYALADRSAGAQFRHILQSLGIDVQPGWPDAFGKAIYEWLSQKYAPIRTLSLFSGGGGLDISFHDAGFNIVEMVEIESKYAKTLSANAQPDGYFGPAAVRCVDIREYTPADDLNVDFVIGGPPCQTFSAAGRRAAGVRGTSDPKGMLFQEYIRILGRVLPRGFLFENVYGMTGAQEGGAWAEIQAAFREAGYTIYHRILDAADYGVPQHRERLFIVGLRDGHFSFPQPTHGPDSPDCQPFYSASDAISDIENDEGLAGIGGKFGYLLNDIPPGLNYSFYTKELGHPNPIFSWRSKFSDYLYKADPHTPTRTLKAQVGAFSGPFHWDNRAFTISEHKRLQTFPDQYKLIGGRQICIQQIGNSVPPQIGRILALSILNQVFGRDLPFALRYMPDNMKLGFRQRKRQLTAKYALKAAVGIRNLPVSANSGSGADAEACQESKMIRYLGDGFGWHKKNVPHMLPVTVNNSFRPHSWRIIGSIKDCPGQEANYRIALSAMEGSDWPLKQKDVYLEGADWNPLLFTGLWKSFEESLDAAYGVADLVQLFGYYQYRTKVRTTLLLYSDPPDPIFWSVLSHVVRSVGVAAPSTAYELGLLWHIEESYILPMLKELRSIGYEVRSRNTNPQIQEGLYLIPYLFPTLTPKSVQLRKRI